jgi:DNA-directed RNA polymerase sigma subunit (sigma70/sigma32)
MDIEAFQEDLRAALATLTPEQAKALRARFGMNGAGPASGAKETLSALVRELAMLKKRKKG